MSEIRIEDLRRQLMSFEANVQLEALQDPTDRIKWQALGVQRTVRFILNFIQRSEGL